MKPKVLLTIARIGLWIKSKSVSNEFDVDHRSCPEGQETQDFRNTYTHVLKSLRLLKKIDIEGFNQFKKVIRRIYYVPNNKYSFEIFSRESMLFISVPYYFVLDYECDDYDYKWYEGLTASLFVRASHLMMLVQMNDDGGKLDNRKMECIISKSCLMEKEFVTKLGRSWVELYESENRKKLPKIKIN